MHHLSFRPRQIEPSRSLPIIRSAKELLGPAEGVARDVPLLPTGMDEEDENEKHIKAALLSRRRAEIPTPVVKTVESYFKNPPAPFVRPHNYIRARGTCVAMLCLFPDRLWFCHLCMSGSRLQHAL